MPGVRRTHQISVQDHRLYYLFVAATHGSMRAAADLLGVAASSISRQIGQLERDLKIDLVEKGIHKMRLTEAGQVLIDYYRSRLDEHEGLLRRLSELRRRRASIVRIAIGDGLLWPSMIAALRPVCERHDDTTIDVVTTSSYEVQRMVSEDLAQIGLLFDTPADVRLRVQAAVDEPILLIMPPGHALGAAPRIDLAAVAEQRLILPAGGLRLAEIVHSVLGQHSLHADAVVTSNALQPIIAGVKGGLGLSLLPSVLVRDELVRGELIGRPVDCADLQATRTHVVTRVGQRLSPAALAILRIVTSSVAQVQAGS